MRIFNELKTQELFSADLSRGYLREDKLVIRIEPAVARVQEQGHYETVQEYPNGGKDIKWVIDVPGMQGKEAQSLYEDIKVYIPYSQAQLEQQKKTRRSKYMDAYRKYQAAINYGEFEGVTPVDDFIERLRNKEWGVFDMVPAQLKYFAGETGFAESGLVRRM